MYFGYIESPIPPGSQSLVIELQANCAINISPESQTLRQRKRDGKENVERSEVKREAPCDDSPPQKARLLVPRFSKPKIFKTNQQGNKFRLYCHHCKATFYSKATYREKYQHHLVNHRCFKTRMQYVVGVRHRRCQQNCDPNVGCIRFDVSDSNESDI